MNAEQVVHLSAEQRELRALAKQAIDLVQFMTGECCERVIQSLIPAIQEAVGASETNVPSDLEEKKGLELVEAVLERRLQQDKEQSKPTSTSKRGRPKTPKTPKTPQSKSERSVTPQKGALQGPPRKQSKVLSGAELSESGHVDEKDGEKDAEQWNDDWTMRSHGNIAEVVGFGRQGNKFGLFIMASENGSGKRKPFPFFADGASLKALDNLEDKSKYRRLTKILLQGLQRCLGDVNVQEKEELVALLKSSKWGEGVLSQLTGSSEESGSE